MRIYNWGVIGTGNIAHSFATDFQYTQGGKIHAVASRSIDRANVFASRFSIENAYGSYKELYEDPDIDIVYIATPHTYHFENATEAMNKGKAVLCEKPLTINPTECQELIEISRQTNNYLMEAMWTYFLPPIQQVLDWIDKGYIGKVIHLKADFGFKAEYNPEGRVFNPKLAGGALMDIGIYPIALTWLVFNQLPTEMSVLHNEAPSGVDLEEIMVFKYADGVYANLTATLSCKLPNEALIVGELGYIRIPDFFMAKECFLYIDDTIKDHFVDQRKSVGYSYEIEAMQSDLAAGKKQSGIVPLKTSFVMQQMIAMVKNEF